MDPDLKFRKKVLRAVGSRDALSHLSGHFGVSVSDGRVLDAHVQALARAPIELKPMLQQLSRDDLKAVCYSLGLDSSGREKAGLIQRIVESGQSLPGNGAAHPKQPAPSAQTPPEAHRVFIGHGRSLLWRELKDFLQDTLHLNWDEFNRESTAGKATTARLEEMLSHASFAFVILTAEDEHGDGKLHARENVVHETGLFQGKLGFHRAIVLLEEGCAEFSNIFGLTEIRFPKGHLMSAGEEIRRVLQREGMLLANK
jgi:predicted nucleotide-binding protein